MSQRQGKILVENAIIKIFNIIFLYLVQNYQFTKTKIGNVDNTEGKH